VIVVCFVWVLLCIPVLSVFCFVLCLFFPPTAFQSSHFIGSVYCAILSGFFYEMFFFFLVDDSSCPLLSFLICP